MHGATLTELARLQRSHHSCIRTRVQHFPDGPFGQGMNQVGSYFSQGLQNKSALPHFRMRDGEPGMLHEGIPVEKKINVNRTVGISAFLPDPAQGKFNGHQGIEKVQRFQTGK